MEDINSPFWVNIIIAIGSLLFGAGGSWVISLFKQRRFDDREDIKTRGQNEMSHTSQAIQVYQDIIKVLRDDIIRFEQYIKSVEEKHLDCAKENAILKTELSFVKRELKELRTEFDNYKKSH